MPILDPHALEIFSRSADQTRRVGMRLGAALKEGDLICLSGELGSGKTTLVQGIARGWGSLDAVSSPSYVLVNEYRRMDGQLLYHLDAYRLANEQEAEDLDVGLLLEQGSLVIEWPEQIKGVLPPERVWADLRWLADEQRGMLFIGKGERAVELVDGLRRRVFGGA